MTETTRPTPRPSRLVVASLLVVLAVFSLPALHAVAEDPLAIGSVTEIADPVGRYQRFEATFELNRAFTNPFDPNEIRVDATFVSPTGSTFVVPAFWYQDFVPSTDASGFESYTPVGSPHWRVRFAPAETGVHTYTIEAQTATELATSESFTFEAILSTEHGLVRLDPGDGRYLRFDDGTTYLPRGHNAAFEDREPFQGGLSVYEPLLDSFAAAKENWTRVWMTDFNRSAIEWSSSHWSGLYGGVGVYSLPSAWRMDHILELAGERDIEVQLVLNDHGQFSAHVDGRWPDNPYNADNGGPVPADHPEEFFTNQAARDLFKQRLRYAVARWGAYPEVLAWELFNEVQFVGSATRNPLNDPQVAADVQAWHAEMAAYLASIDPLGHLVTTSSDAPGVTEPIWQDPNVDLVQVHDYASPPTSRFAQTIQELRTTYAKPVIFGEFGLSGSPEAGFDPATFPGSAEDRNHLLEATHLRNTAWTAALAGSGAMSWWWGTYLAADASRNRTPPNFPANEQIFPALDVFVNDLDIVALGLEPSLLTPSDGLFAVGMSSATRAVAWVRDDDSEFGSGVDPADADVSGATLEIAGMQDRLYRVEFWSTRGTGGVTGTPIELSAVGGTLTVPLPDFTGDIALSVEPVVFDFDGFFEPVDNPPTVNLAKAGSAIPVPFTLHGDQGLGILAAGTPTVQTIDCSDVAGNPTDSIEQTAPRRAPTLSYDATTDMYTFVWRTDRTLRRSCRQFTLTLADGTSHVALFRFR